VPTILNNILIQSFTAANYTSCLDECTNSSTCSLASFTPSNSSCSIYNLSSNSYAFASPETTLYQKQVPVTGSVQ
jgi:hypothetical protein